MIGFCEPDPPSVEFVSEAPASRNWQSGCNGKLLEASKRGEQIALRCVACAETYCVNSP